MPALATLLARAAAPVVDYALPARCPGCGRIVPDAAFCQPCWTDLDPVGDPGVRVPAGLDGAAAACGYGEVSRAVVLAFKHGNRPRLARAMGGLMALALDRLDPPPSALLVPVPLHRTRLWRRGYNQAALLSRDVSARKKLAHSPDALVRLRATQPQHHGRAARAAAVAGAFAVPVTRAALVTGRDIVLVDDVLTTGATAGGCTAALRKAGARSVRLLCWASVTRH